MDDFKIKEKIREESNKKYKGSYRFFKPKYLQSLIGKDGCDRIYSKVSKELHQPYSLVIHCFMNDILSHPICECGNNQKFNTTLKKFSKYCSNQCKWKDNESLQRIKKETNMAKYGNSNVLASEYGKKKIVDTCVKKYGVTNYTKTEEYKTSVRGKVRSEETKIKMRESQREQFYNSLSHRYKHCKALFKLDEYEGVKGYKEYNWFCNSCKLEFLSSCDNGSSPICRHCKPIGTKHELVVRDYLTKLGIPFEYNWRGLPSKKEIDVYIPSMNLGFEICGLYWHSTSVTTYNKMDHINKHEECESIGIRLVTIFDDEFYHKKQQVLNRIKNSVGKITRKIYARKCEIVELSNSDSEKFLSKYHIQGSIYGQYKYGLKFKNRLVAVMTFNKGRHATGHHISEGKYELGRYCTVANFKVIGGAGKLFKHFIKNINPEEIYSYSDKRWNSGGLYETIGMTYVKDTVPNYYYTKTFRERLSRVMYQKHMLTRFPSYDVSLTEEEIMKREKYYRTWDCGSKLFTWKNPTQNN